ncbi:MAG: DNA-binding response regulator [Anaerolinea sp.]|nr:DNA-binding response regulator [Anaerolinea sp.]
MEPIRIVIAEDHAFVREGTRRLLDQTPGLKVVGEAADGAEAVRLVEQLRPHVALIDIAMPNVNGIEATRQIKARAPATSVLVLSAYDDDQYVFALLEAGAAGYLLKDVHSSELIDAIRAVHAGEPVLHPAIERKVLQRFAARRVDGREDTRLSGRELDVLRLAARGASNKEIGGEMGLSARTVQAHLTHVFTKLDVASRTEAVIYALRRGWISLDETD